MSLFRESEEENLSQARPLAERMRPRRLDEFAGQRHFLGEGKLLRRLITADRLGSILFCGPPGCGKTSLARLLASSSSRRFVQISAVLSNVKELREILAAARARLAAAGERTLLFIDEIHRFNKAQQDALLRDVEEGVVTLVGATTENPSFSIIHPLVSRSTVFRFEALGEEDIVALLRRALQDDERGLGAHRVEADADALEYLARVADGDARRALAALEIGVLSSFPPSGGQVSSSEGGQPRRYSLELARESVQRKSVAYDRQGDQHYDAISALIKSIRGSDADAALYWLARMLEGGEEVRFLARRLVILASEDVGNTDPAALPLAVACMHACEFVGLPECQLTLAQAVIYLALAPKSNAATVAIGEARQDVTEGRLQPVPVHLRDPRSTGSRGRGQEEEYQYSHASEDGVVAQEYLGVDREYYRPVARGFERELGERLVELRQKIRAGRKADA